MALSLGLRDRAKRLVKSFVVRAQGDRVVDDADDPSEADGEAAPTNAKPKPKT